MKSRSILFIAIISSMLIAAACGGGGSGSGGSVRMYITNAGSASISGFSLSSGGSVGNLSGSPYTAGNTPTSVAVVPGNFLLSTNAVDNTISRFRSTPADF